MFKKKVKSIPVKVNPELLTAKATLMVENAMSMFSKAVKEIDSANEMLEDSKKMSEEEIVKMQMELRIKENEKLKAEDNIKMNDALKEKLSQFVV